MTSNDFNLHERTNINMTRWYGLIALVTVLMTSIAIGVGLPIWASATVFYVGALASLVALWPTLPERWQRVTLLVFGLSLLTSASVTLAQFGLIVYAIILLSVGLALLAWMVIGVLHLLGRSGGLGWVGIFQSVTVAGLTVLLGSVLLAPPALPDETASSEDQMAHLHMTDGYDRDYGVYPLMYSRDRACLRRLLNLYAAGEIDTTEEKYQGAWVLQHSSVCQEQHELAFQFAREARTEADFIYQATYDRWQNSLGKEGRYGTQMTTNMEAGKPACDHPMVPDELRMPDEIG